MSELPQTRSFSLTADASHAFGAAAVLRDEGGIVAPYETDGFPREAGDIASGLGGWFDLSFWQCVRVAGPDRIDFLQRLTTWDARRADAKRADRIALLTGRAHAVALGWVLPREGAVDLFFPAPQGARAAAHLEAMHFAEDLTVTNISSEWVVVAGIHPVLCSEQSPSVALLAAPPRQVALFDSFGALGWNDDVQSDLFWCVVPRDRAIEFAHALVLPRLGTRLFEFLRREALVPEVGKELPTDSIFLEGGFDAAIARAKGCYPGQEVVERIFTYGSVNRKLCVVEFPKASDPLPIPSPLYAASDTATVVGQLVACDVRPRGTGVLGIAFLRRGSWEAGTRLHVGVGQAEALVVAPRRAANVP